MANVDEYIVHLARLYAGNEDGFPKNTLLIAKPSIKQLELGKKYRSFIEEIVKCEPKTADWDFTWGIFFNELIVYGIDANNDERFRKWKEMVECGIDVHKDELYSTWKKMI